MDDQVTPVPGPSSAVQAFEELRGEVSLLRRAIEGLAAERCNQPNYGPTLEALATSFDETRRWARRISEQPALQLTPQRVSEQIETAVAVFRQADRDELQGAKTLFISATAELKALFQQARTAYEQARQVKIAGGLGLLGGFLLWPICAQIEIVWR